MTDGGPTDLLPPTYLGGPTITPDNCDREPIQIPGSIQPQGALLTVDAGTQLILQVSANTGPHLGHPPDTLRGNPLTTLLPEAALQPLLAALPAGSPDHLQYRATLDLPSGRTALTAHRVGDLLILEFEASEGHDPTGPQALRNAVFALESAPSLAELTREAAALVREISGFDRVMVYRFARDASGEVIAEARREGLPPFLGHRFPESDIPAQARALYVRHLLRLTADTHAAPVPLEPVLNPQTGQPTPLGGAVLRATSPMHLQYLRNMGVASSLSVSIVVEGRLWGLISCHHLTAYVVPPGTRTALEYLGRLLSLQVQVKARADTDAFRARLQARHARLVEAAAHSLAPLDTFADEGLDLEGLMRASGVIVFFEGRWRARGLTPEPAQVEALLAWLRTREGTLFHTDALSEQWPPAAAFTDRASGLLAVSVGNGWSEGVVWLRPAITTTVAWGGATPEQAKGKLGPRRSFETYVETVRGRAEPWHAGELEEAQDLQRALTAALGERLSVVRELNAALERANAEWRQYAFVIAHDMQEPVRLIAQFAELVHLRYRDQVDQGGERMIRFLLDETARLRSLTHDLHAYTALLSAPPPVRRPIALGQVLQDVLETLAPQIEETGAEVRVEEALPTLHADPARLRDLLLHLVKNALTFGGPRPCVQVSAERVPGAWNVTVRDQGPGIAPEYHEKVFGLFQRLGRREESPGNGIGLALCRKIAERHGGSLHLTSLPGQGSALTFHLPDPGESPDAV
ncbi:GAF domain-containing protein (plasmid) [Deinococcus metallilatus]|uniref:histidine kinase n=1 Tax=Deinococcus metallilatus TaxID=1211322 RepID=A0AAJ5F629_9DEIO|nr:ATP-binding protein [Deinococcus metallilatus]MBB5293346.1 light-regulated signal transduction histidine kinase (bacteriophytochrome) [Deinococcus metallilatus]QBY06452.1 GAF domain-containing protein [Deinococcus metallilatus]RXJ18131.1 GAF domain-containing protein [Deinococcus metallilatus]TLK32067.1 GAF domain-containing protein [Deinococcus metallilatus]GMA15431.1 bacteriophytochrome [Deinococcus metallilatus]